METYERFKVESGVWLDRCFATEHVNFWNIAAYSQPRLTKRLNKANKAKLEKLMDPATPVDTYIQGVGFKTYYIYDRGCDPFVYVIASEPRELNPADAERETILLRRYDPATFYGNGDNGQYGRMWDPGTCQHIRKQLEKAVQHYMNNERTEVQPVFLDRLTRREREALALLYLLEDKGYIEGIGGVRDQTAYYPVRGAMINERVFFLEKPSNLTGGKTQR